MRIQLILSSLALALCVALTPAPVLAKSHKAEKPSKEERDVLTKARLEAAPCTIEELMDQIEADTGQLAIEGNFKCKFKNDTCRFSIEAVDPIAGVGVSEYKFGEDCLAIPAEFFEPDACPRADALAFARASVADVFPEDLTLCKIEQEIEEDEVAMTMHNVWEIKLSISDDPATPDVNEFRRFKFEVEDTGDPLNGCALFEEEEEED